MSNSADPLNEYSGQQPIFTEKDIRDRFEHDRKQTHKEIEKILSDLEKYSFDSYTFTHTKNIRDFLLTSTAYMENHEKFMRIHFNNAELLDQVAKVIQRMSEAMECFKETPSAASRCVYVLLKIPESLAVVVYFQKPKDSKA